MPMKWPCNLGFSCPHRCLGEEGEVLCMYPETEVEEDRAYEVAEDWVLCPLMDDGPLLEYLLAYDELNEGAGE